MSAGTVFVFATKTEAQPLLDSFDAVARRDSWLPVYELGDLQVLICGSGLAAAGAAIDYLAAVHQPLRVVSCGVASRLHDGLRVGDIAQIGRASFTNAQRTTTLPVSGLAQGKFGSGQGDCSLLSRVAPLTDGTEHSCLGKSADLVDREGAAIVSACLQHGIECGMFKVVADYPDGKIASLGWKIELNTRLAAFLLMHMPRLLVGGEYRDDQRVRAGSGFV